MSVKHAINVKDAVLLPPLAQSIKFQGIKRQPHQNAQLNLVVISTAGEKRVADFYYRAVIRFFSGLISWFLMHPAGIGRQTPPRVTAVLRRSLFIQSMMVKG